MDVPPAGPTGSSDHRRRIDEVLKWTARSLADEIRELDGGSVERSRALPDVHSLNRLRVTSSMAPHDILALAGTHLDGLPYRHICVDDAQTAAAFEGEVVTAGSGWNVEREVFMVLGEPVLGEPVLGEPVLGEPVLGEPVLGELGPASPLVRLRPEEMDQLMRRWLAEELADISVDELDQLSEYNRREGELWNEEVLGVREAGQPVALTKSRAHDDVGWVEDVYTAPEARRKGYARLLVGRAVAIARRSGHALTFIIADDNDWPKHLYAELGFQPIGCTWTFHRKLEG